MSITVNVPPVTESVRSKTSIRENREDFIRIRRFIMKKNILAFLLLGACSMHAQSLVTDPCSSKFYTGTKTPLNWYIQAPASEKANVSYQELGENKRIIRLSPKKDKIQFFFGSAINVMKGDRIKITVKAKGSGSCKVGFFAYKAKNANSFVLLEPLTLTEKEQTFTRVLTVKDNADGAKTETVRIMVQAMPGAHVELYSLTAVMEE